MVLQDKSVIKHSAAVQISNSINLLQRRAWNVLLANAYYDLPDREVFEVDYDEYMQVLGISKRRNRRYVEEYLGGLISTRIEWNVLGKVSKEDWDSEWGATGLLASAVIKRVQGRKKILYSYSVELRKRLYNPHLYARISLSMQNKFNSKHALALYELCVDYFIAKKRHGQSPFIALADFRKVMGVKDNEYKEFKFLKQWIIKKPLLEINRKSDLLVRVEYKKERRKVVALKLFITPQKNNQALLTDSPVAKEKNMELYKRLRDYFQLTSIQAHDVLAMYKEKDIQANLTYVEQKIQEGTVRTIGAYTLKAIKENYRDLPNLFDQEEAEKQKNMTEEEQRKRSVARLGEEYEQEKERVFAELLTKTSQKKLAELEVEVAEEIEERYGENFRFAKTIGPRMLRGKLLAQSGFASREKWITEKMRPDLPD